MSRQLQGGPYMVQLLLSYVLLLGLAADPPLTAPVLSDSSLITGSTTEAPVHAGPSTLPISAGAASFPHATIATWRQYVSPLVLTVGLILAISTLLYALWWVPREVYKKRSSRHRRSRYLYVRTVPLLATVALFLMLILLLAIVVDRPTGIFFTIFSLAFTVSSVLFAVLSIASLGVALWSFRLPVPSLVRWHALIVAIGLCALTVVFAYWQVIGIRLWEW